MFKKIKIYITAGLLLVLAIGCSDNSTSRKRYELERLAYEAKRQGENIGVRPELILPEKAQALDQAYVDLVGACYGALDSSDADTYPDDYRQIERITFEAVAKLSQFKFAQRRFDSCAYLMDELLQKVKLPAVEQMLAYYNLGRALQAGRHWDSSVAVYDAATTTFSPPVDRTGEIVYQIFNLPLHLYYVNLRINDTVAAKDRFGIAESYYTQFLKAFPDTKLEIAANASLARLYELSGQMQMALDYTAQLVDSSGRVNPAARLRMADLLGFGMGRANEALVLYDELIEEMADSDTVLAATALYKKAQTLMSAKRYSDARLEIINVERRYPMLYRGLPAAQLTKAQTFEFEGNWDRAETEYRYLIDNYRGTDAAMSTHLHLIRHYTESGLTERASQWKKRAEEYYDQVIMAMAGTVREAAAMSYKAELFRQHEDWEMAASTLVSIYSKFPMTEVGQKAGLTAAELYRDKLNQPEQAASLVADLRARLTESSQAAGISGS